MTDFEEFGDEKPKKGEAEAGEGPSGTPLYDPIIEPWEDLFAPAAFGVDEGEDPFFRLDWATGWQAEGAWEAPPGGPPLQERQLGAWPPAYQEREALSEAQRRLRAETITLPRPRRRWQVTVREVVETLLLALLIFLAVRTSFQNFRVEGTSMMPSLEDGEYLIVNKLSYAEIDMSMFNWLPFYDAGLNPVHYLWDAPDRGDVIVFRSPNDVDRDFIKRIIGLPGDTIEIEQRTNQVLVNGKAIEEPYARGPTICSSGCGPWTLPPANSEQSVKECGSRACYFVMGDNRQNSSDSRQGWFVPQENVIGKALITYWHEGGPEFELAPNYSLSPASEAEAKE